jgi:hypothetical protein
MECSEGQVLEMILQLFTMEEQALKLLLIQEILTLKSQTFPVN